MHMEEEEWSQEEIWSARMNGEERKWKMYK